MGLQLNPEAPLNVKKVFKLIRSSQVIQSIKKPSALNLYDENSRLKTRVDQLEEELKQYNQFLKSKKTASLNNPYELLNVYLELLVENEKLRTTSTTDPLTGLKNRGYLYEEIAKIQSQIKRNEYTNDFFTVLMLDLNYLKLYNDRFGHPIGDLAIQMFANELKRLEKTKFRATDYFARYGGDEFVIIIPGKYTEKNKNLDAVTQTILNKVINGIKTIDMSEYVDDAHIQKISYSIGIHTITLNEVISHISNNKNISHTEILNLLVNEADTQMKIDKIEKHKQIGYSR